MQDLRIGIIGCDTSHVVEFTRLLNDKVDPDHVAGGNVVAAYPSFSADMPASVERVEGFADQLRQRGVDIVDSIDAVIACSDAILLESVDGRRHLAEAEPVIRARKPLFIDKPLAHNYRDAVKIADLAAQHQCPLFSSSSLRFDANIAALRADTSLGEIIAVDVFSPAHLDATNPGLFMYGIHGVEILYSFMGTGCRKVSCHTTDAYHVVVGEWNEGRTATLRGIRGSAGDYGITVFGEHKVAHTTYSREVPFYSQLLKEIIPFMQGSSLPVDMKETLEIMAFVQASLISEKEKGGVLLEDIDK